MAYVDEVLADSPVGYWRMDETSGTTMVDSSGNSRDGTYATAYNSTPVLGQTSILPAGGGTSVLFEGSPDACWVTHNTAFNATTAGFTFECWVKFTSLPGSTTIIADKTSAGSSDGQWGVWWGGSYIRFLAGNVSCDWNTANGAGAALTTGGHLVCVVDATNIRMYWDGVLKASSASAPTTLSALNQRSLDFVGHDRGSRWFMPGKLDEIAVYQSALSLTRIQAHYTAAAGGPTPVSVAGSVANVAVAGRVGAPVTPVRIEGSVANVAVAAHVGTLDVGGTAVTVAGSVASVAVAALPGAPVIGAVAVETSTEFANDGYNYDGMAAVYYEDPIAEPPAHINRTKVLQVHQSMSAPVLVNGRPT